MILSPDIAEKLRSANMANIVAKIKNGKTLTAAESKLVDAASASTGEKQSVTTSRLAEIFGINRKTISQWRKENRPGIPAKIGTDEDLNAWRAWFADNPSAGHFDGKPRADRETLLCEKLTVEIAIKRIELEESIGAVVNAGEVEEHMAAIGSVIKAMLKKMENDLPPILEGLPASGIKKEIARHHEKIFQSFAEEIERVLAKRRRKGVSQNFPADHQPEPVAVGRRKRANPK